MQGFLSGSYSLSPAHFQNFSTLAKVRGHVYGLYVYSIRNVKRVYATRGFALESFRKVFNKAKKRFAKSQMSLCLFTYVFLYDYCKSYTRYDMRFFWFVISITRVTRINLFYLNFK